MGKPTYRNESRGGGYRGGGGYRDDRGYGGRDGGGYYSRRSPSPYYRGGGGGGGGRRRDYRSRSRSYSPRKLQSLVHNLRREKNYVGRKGEGIRLNIFWTSRVFLNLSYLISQPNLSP